jgi:hypothetical protein
MNKYSVSVWNLEKIYAKSEVEAVARMKQEFYGDWYTARDFEFDDVELVEEELHEDCWKAWNLYKDDALTEQFVRCEITEEFDDDDEFLVTIIGTVFVEAEDEGDAEDVARDVFDYINKDEFEIHTSI